LVPAEFYNILFIAFHTSPIGEHFNTYHTLHCMCLRFTGPACSNISNACAVPALAALLQIQPT
jgi:hypothetical protein